MRTELCLCRDLDPLPTRTRVLVLLHRIERYKTTNTGRIATLALADSELREWDLLDAPNVAEGLSDPGACLLYPSASARELDPANPPSLLVVPDATWHVTRSMVRKSPELSAMPRVRLPEGGPSVFRLRENRHPGAVCTLEAVARALGVLEGPEVEAHLMDALEEMTRRVESTRPPMMLEGRSAALRARSDPADPGPG